MAQPSDLIGNMLAAGAQNDPMRGFITAAQAADQLITSRQNRKVQLEELELQHGQLILQQLNSDRNYEIDKEKLGIELAKSNREAELMPLTKRKMAAEALHQEVTSEVLKANLINQASELARQDIMTNQMLADFNLDPLPIRGQLDPIVIAQMGTSLYDPSKLYKPGSTALNVPSPQEAEARFNYTSTLEVAQNAHANADWMDAEADKIASKYKPLLDAIPRRRTEAKVKRAVAETKRKKIGEGKYASMSASEVMAEAMKLAEAERAGEYKGLVNAGGSQKLIALAQQKEQAEKEPNPEADQLEKEASNLEQEAIELEGKIDVDAMKRADDMRANAKRLREESTKEVSAASTNVVSATVNTWFLDTQKAGVRANMMKQYMPNIPPDTVDSMVAINLYNRGVEQANVIREHGGDVKEENKKLIEKLLPGFFSTAVGKELEATVPSDRLMPVTAIDTWKAEGMRSMSPEIMASQMLAKQEATTTPIKYYDGRTVLKKTTELDKVQTGEDVRTGEIVAWDSNSEITQTQSTQFTKAKQILEQIDLIKAEVAANPDLLKNANVMTKWKRQIANQLGIPIKDAEANTAIWGNMIAKVVQNMYSGQASTDVEASYYINALAGTTDTEMGFQNLLEFGNTIRKDMVTNYNFQAEKGTFVPPSGLHPSAIAEIKKGRAQAIDKGGFKPYTFNYKGHDVKTIPQQGKTIDDIKAAEARLNAAQTKEEIEAAINNLNSVAIRQ